MPSFINFDKKNQTLLNWLKNLFLERMGKDIVVTLRTDLVRIAHVGHPTSINITEHNNEFYHVGGNVKYSDCSFSELGLRKLGRQNYPSPGRIKPQNAILEESEIGYNLNYDLMGLIFWKLSLIEEMQSNVLDVHQRVCGKKTHAFEHNYLHLPIVDMWFHILQIIAKKLWSNYTPPNTNFKVTPTHDIDRPAKYQFQTKFKAIKLLLLERSLKNMSLNLFDILTTDGRSQPILNKNDPFNTFDWLMTQSELRGLQSEFYFLSGTNSQEYDADFDLNYPSIRSLSRSIFERGHRVGVHPSYGCYKNDALCKSEIMKFREMLASECIDDQTLNSRMHYLRWSHPVTMHILNNHGVTHDSTLGYHDCAGFRCGTSIEYTAIDPCTKEVLPLLIRPLIAMESALLPDKKKQVSDFEELYSKFVQLKSECQKYGGNFIFLWHNSELYSEPMKYIYTSVLDS